MTVDLDSTVCEVHGRAKQGAAYGHTRVLGYHPLLAVRDDTGELLHSRMRSGSSQRGHLRFVSETLARLRRPAPGAAVTVRADAGFFSYDMVDRICARGASYSITVPQNSKVKTATAAIDEGAWAPIPYTRGGTAQVAETTIDTGRRDPEGPRRLRLIVRRTRLEGPRRELWPNRRHHCFVTDRSDLDAAGADAHHRAHARVGLAVRDHHRHRPAPLPLGQVLRQRRPARLRRPRPQHHTLDRAPRTRPAPRAAHRRQHHATTAPHSARPPPQPQPPTHPAPAPTLALGPHPHPSTATPPQPAPAHLTPGPGTRRPPAHTPRRHQPAKTQHPRPGAPPQHPDTARQPRTPAHNTPDTTTPSPPVDPG